MHPVTVVAKQHRPVRPRTGPTRARIGELSTIQKLADIARLRVNRHAIAHIIKVPKCDQIPRRNAGGIDQELKVLKHPEIAFSYANS